MTMGICSCFQVYCLTLYCLQKQGNVAVQKHAGTPMGTGRHIPVKEVSAALYVQQN